MAAINENSVRESKPFLLFRQTSEVGLECSIDLTKLFPDEKDRNKFQNNFKKFCESQPTICKIIQDCESDLIYQSEQLIPSKKDKRPPGLFVFGNPATHSINNGMFFSSEGKNGGEHRFWKSILPTAGIDDLNLKDIREEKERNQQRLRALLELNYKAPIRIGLCVLISFPSAASGDYSGIQGVKRLFGSKAMAELVKYENERVLSVIKEFLAPNGAVFTFHSDAWSGLKRYQDSVYDISKAMAGRLEGRVAEMPEIRLFGLPPTRLSGPAGEVLNKFLSEIERDGSGKKTSV